MVQARATAARAASDVMRFMVCPLGRPESAGVPLSYNLLVQFSVETVRTVAQILSENDLGEISLEGTGTPGCRLTLRRAVPAAALDYEEPETELETEPEVVSAAGGAPA